MQSFCAAFGGRTEIIMILTDTHTHTVYSFDGIEHATVDAMCRRATELGLKYLCITDHYEANYKTQYPEFKPYDAEGAAKEIFEAKEKYKDDLSVIYGIECGQITQSTESALEFLKDRSFEFVIGSLHNTNGDDDPYFMDMSRLTQKELRANWDKYLEELYSVASFECFDTLAHLTYPLRYCVRDNNPFDITYSADAIAMILKRVIDNGMCLEVNSSGFRQNMNAPVPDKFVLSMYKELGGELLSIGSDAHMPEHMAYGFKQTEEYLKNLGFKYYHLKTKNNLLSFNL
jgi:histidinol-phosphatase (PHP family)